jgi:hypothetical protein
VAEYVKAAKTKSKIGAQVFEWKMIKSPYIWKLTIPFSADQFGTLIELWSDGTPDQPGILIKAPMDDDDDDVLFCRFDEVKAEAVILQACAKKVWDKGK